LGKLMTEGTCVPPAEKSAANSPSTSPGVGALLRGANGFKKTQSELEQAGTLHRCQNIPQKRLIQAALVAGDLLLLGLAARLAWKAGGPLGTSDLMLCLVALVLGAALSFLAFWLE
jgi:hypothetical protein